MPAESAFFPLSPSLRGEGRGDGLYPRVVSHLPRGEPPSPASPRTMLRIARRVSASPRARGEAKKGATNAR